MYRTICNNNSICNNQNHGVLPAQNLPEGSNNHCSEQNFREALCECIGLKCTCEFAIGRDLVSKAGVLERVGSNYLLLRSNNSQNALLCDFCDLKFVTVTC